MKLIMPSLKLTLLCLFAVMKTDLKAESNPRAEEAQALQETILRIDNLFWKSCNSCDLPGMRKFITDDIEFYHDKDGLTVSAAKVMKSIETGLCANKNMRIRREVVEGSVEVFPLDNYGAIQTGEHRFYVTNKGKKERLDATAKFTHVWQKKNSSWKIARVLSYDHQVAAQKNAKTKELVISDDVLESYLGKYKMPHAGTVAISKEGHALKVQGDGFLATIFPETETLFFHKERDLTFEFVIGKKGRVQKMIVREGGEVVDEAIRVK